MRSSWQVMDKAGWLGPCRCWYVAKSLPEMLRSTEQGHLPSLANGRAVVARCRVLCRLHLRAESFGFTTTRRWMAARSSGGRLRKRDMLGVYEDMSLLLFFFSFDLGFKNGKKKGRYPLTLSPRIQGYMYTLRTCSSKHLQRRSCVMTC